MCYIGHPGGLEEYEQVWVRTLLRGSEMCHSRGNALVCRPCAAALLLWYHAPVMGPHVCSRANQQHADGCSSADLGLGMFEEQRRHMLQCNQHSVWDSVPYHLVLAWRPELGTAHTPD